MPMSPLRSWRRPAARPRITRTSVRVTRMAVNMLINTPMANVTAKPSTALAPKLRPKVHAHTEGRARAHERDQHGRQAEA